ncbi:IS66 family transposase [Tepidibacillus fermentans]|uniref:IS66 family transposase n=1 Tax=Tepidibacillus fermentans TaxID=1281767 RepID=UPI001047ACA2|nr:IS66 family transposase [Tepidibacillus fermentans]
MDLTKYSRKELEEAYIKLSIEKEQTEIQLQWYQEQFRLSRQKLFGKSSEKNIDDHQLSLPIFNEAETEHQPINVEPQLEDDVHVDPLNTKPRKKKGKRERDLLKLPKKIVEYKLSKEEQVCPKCSNPLHEVRPEIRKELEVIPAKVIVKEIHRMIYSCRTCEKVDTTVPMIKADAPNPVIKGSIASPSLLADIMTKKYVDATPLYRQEQEYKRRGLPINRQNMSNWIIRVSKQWLTPLFKRMQEILVSYDVLHADETELEVLNEPGREAATKSYMWMYRTGNGHKPIVLYDYQPSRSGDNAKSFLMGFKGYLQTDAYHGYDKLLKKSNAGPPMEVTLVACFAHSRRYFTETLKAVTDKKSYMHTSAYQGVKHIDGMFALEKELADKSYVERYEERLRRLKPMLEAYFAWIEKEHAHALPKSSYGKAINYSFNQKDKLMNILKDGRLELSNNRAERAIKPFVIGRKNWLFTNTPAGAESSAIVYSTIETAKENNLIPFEYLKYLFEKLPNMDVTNSEELDKLLPWSNELPDNLIVK